MNRRAFIQATGTAAAASLVSASVSEGVMEDARKSLPDASAAHLPRWRGFNLLEMFMAPQAARFRESDYSGISELGFNFTRLPLDYRCWVNQGDWRKLREDRLVWVDDAVAFGKKYGVHVQINFHRAPGFTVASPAEAKSVWKDEEAREVCALHWGTFAKRYAGISNREVSFNLFNEPAGVEAGPYKETVARMISAIREVDKDRLIVCDGRDYGTKPPTELVGLGVATATRGYAPFHLTHYKANWVNGSDKWAAPTYPMIEGGKPWNRESIQRDQITPWKALEAKGVGVMVGEFGAYSKTPHPVVLAWMRDCLDAWKSAGWGWALWNYRGGFGILDSDRADVTYESKLGGKLDRDMLNLLQSA